MTERCSLLIENGTVVDGLGGPGRRSDVAVLNDRISAVGPELKIDAAKRIDARGRVVCPGFIDVHTHDDRALLSHPDMAFKVSQGVTSVVAGNCGVSLAPLVLQGQPPPPLDLLGCEPGWFRFSSFADYHQALVDSPPALNCALLVGHITLRHRVMKNSNRAADRLETAAMSALVEEAMDEGAIGFSTGLDYPASVNSTFDEVLELVKRVRPFGGLFCCHHRNYFSKLEAALDEVFAFGRKSGVPVIISHHQCSGAGNFGKAPMTLERIESERRRTPIGLDAYPYNASSKTLDPERAGPGVRILVTWSTSHPEAAGQMLDDIAADWGLGPRQAAEKLLPAGAVYFQLDEADVRAILSYPHTMFGSDGLPHDVHPHPRLWGTFPRVLGHYARDLGLFSLEEAVRRMTSLPAAWFGLRDRGAIRAGAFADIVVFDPERISDRASFTKPIQACAGIDRVICNGRITWHDGAHSGERPGRVLRRDRDVTVMSLESPPA